MTTRITYHHLALAVHRLNSVVHPHIVNNQPQFDGLHVSLSETALVGAFLLRPVGKACYALHRIILDGNVKTTEVVFFATNKRAALDRISYYTDGVQHALLHIPRPSRADAAPYNGIYARYICKNTMVSASDSCPVTGDEYGTPA
jgi:hypothetical protein